MQTINTGTAIGSFTGEGVHDAMVKVNANFTDLDTRSKKGYQFISSATTALIPPTFTADDRVYYCIDCPASATTLTLANFPPVVIPILTVPTRYNLKWTGTTWIAVVDYVLTKNNLKASLTETVPGNALEATMGKVLADMGASIIADEKSMFPAIAFNKRVVADLGTINTQLTARIYAESQAKNASIYLLLSGAYKARTSVLNQYVNKAYDYSPFENDAVNTVDATQAFLDGFIAPKANLGIKYISGQTQTGVLTFGTAKVFQAADSWTLRVVVKYNKNESSINLSAGTVIYRTLTYIRIITPNGILVSANCPFESGKDEFFEFQCSNGSVSVKRNTIPLTVTVVGNTSITFSYISITSPSTFDGTLYSFGVYPYRCSEAESVKETTFLKSVFPEMETVVINGYEITTQNAENIVASDGALIPNVTGNTTDGNPELVVNGSFDSGSTGWAVTGNDSTHIATFAGGTLRFQSDTTTPVLDVHQVCLTVGKLYRITTITSSWTSGGIKTDAFGKSDILSNSAVNTPVYGIAISAVLNITRLNTNVDLTIDSISVKEVGWDSSTLIYDATYAATSGSVNVKTLAAQKAAAAYCLYNNDPLLGAIYGKHYNWYAAVLLAPKGWHVLSFAEMVQISANLGGDTVSGAKMKAKFGGFDNAFSSNESGFSLIPNGRRTLDGTFSDRGTGLFLWGKDARPMCFNSDLLFQMASLSSHGSGFALRFARNTPYGDQFQTVTNSTITNIASVALNTKIPWGYRPKAIRIISTTNLTLIEAKLLNTSSAVVATLITGKACNATDITFPVLADFSVGYTDYSVAITATGNTDLGLQVFILLEKSPA